MDPVTLIDCGVATATVEGETQSGDLYLVRPVAPGVLVSVVDGLGHGSEAASAARVAVEALERHASEVVLPTLERCHAALRGTRGVVLSLAFFDGEAESLTWLSVGNVAGVLVHATGAGGRTRTSLLTRGGIVGADMPQLRAEVIPLAPGDTLIFATDGIAGGFAEDLPARASPQQLADDILTRYRTGKDDALVLVARYRGNGGTGR